MSITTPVTAEQLFDMPDDGLRRELVHGEVFTMNPAGSEHGAVISELTGLLWQFVRQHHLGRLFGAETGFVLQRNPDTVRAPDVAFVRKSRIADTGIPATFFPGPPDLAIEVLSPSEVKAKVDDWLSHGVIEVWLVDPRQRTVTVHRLGSDFHVLGDQDFVDAPDLLPGFRLSVAEIFPTA